MLHGPGAGPALKCTAAIWWYNCSVSTPNTRSLLPSRFCPLVDPTVLCNPSCWKISNRSELLARMMTGMAALWHGSHCKVILLQSQLGNYLFILQWVTTLLCNKSHSQGEGNLNQSVEAPFLKVLDENSSPKVTKFQK